ncbi:hypothetical protein BKA08_002354 [Nocardioides marinisabuli]|uniref:Lipoprotein n=1 Tax=Nocardioides marinisabuli TaxID=419476 RepID=A0A7Y9JRD4_9ACTN|nr:hypothetical protein [Nocardioides marinisabuli]NYD58116.1 hypothetical protein [Nocardioides marinisabuli]
MRCTRLAGLLLLAPVLLGGGCSDPGPDAAPSPSSSPSSSPSTGPSTGLAAELRQSSLDVARGQMQVWVENGTGAPLLPTSVRYVDDRLGRPIAGERLREVPEGARFGFVLPLPPRPACGPRAQDRGVQQVQVRAAQGEWRAPVADETDVLGRHLAARCLERAVAEAVDLRWLPVRHDGRRGSTATMVLEARPTGEPGHRLVIDTVSGTPLLGAARAPHWSPGVLVRSDGAVVRLPLEAQAARCDDHVFMEGGGSTAFRVGLRLDGQPGQLLVRMSERVSATAVAFVRESCGL